MKSTVFLTSGSMRTNSSLNEKVITSLSLIRIWGLGAFLRVLSVFQRNMFPFMAPYKGGPKEEGPSHPPQKGRSPSGRSWNMSSSWCESSGSFCSGSAHILLWLTVVFWTMPMFLAFRKMLFQ